MTRVVSVTRLALRRDKRTFQNAASLARMGYDSVVVQGEPGEIEGDLPFQVLTVPGAEAVADVALTDPVADPPRAPAAETSEGDGSRGIPVLSPLGVQWNRFRNWARFPRLLAESHRRETEAAYAALPDADLYYLTFYWQFPAVARKCRETGARYVYDANDAYWRWPGYRWYPAAFRARLRLIELRCVRGAAGFVTVSEGVADLLKRRYGRRPEVVRNMHDLRVDTDSPVDVRRDAGLGDDAFVVVIVGNEKPSDSVDAALVALAELPERVHLVTLGAGYERHDARARERGVADRVHSIRPVPPNEVTSAIGSADACLINIRAQEVHMHALPTRLFSAVAAGLPIVYPPLPEVAALCREHGLGIEADAEDPASLATAIRRLAEDPAAAGEIRANVERARPELSWEHEERKLASIVEEALAR